MAFRLISRYSSSINVISVYICASDFCFRGDGEVNVALDAGSQNYIWQQRSYMNIVLKTIEALMIINRNAYLYGTVLLIV